MSRSLVVAIVIGVLVASSCSEPSALNEPLDSGEVSATVLAGDGERPGTIIVEDWATSRSGPDEPPTGAEVMRLYATGYTFILYSQGDRCMQVAVEGGGIQTTVDSFCATDWQPLDASRDCGIFEESDSESSCDVDLPQVIYGHILDPGMAHVCIGKMSEDNEVDGGVFDVRRLDVDPQGFTMSFRQPSEDWAAHLLDSRGIPIGDPPLDAPSGPIYKRCRDLILD